MSDKTVLVVDDQPDARVFLAVLLQTNGYAPVMAKDGAEGLAKARHHRPDLIILDVMMPGEGGARMYRQLKTDSALKAIPVIMSTAVGATTFYHYLNMLNLQLADPIPQPNGYMEKPLDPQRLLRMIQRLVEP